MMPDIDHTHHPSQVSSIVLMLLAGTFHFINGMNFGAAYDITFKILALLSVTLSITISLIKLLRKPKQ